VTVFEDSSLCSGVSCDLWLPWSCWAYANEQDQIDNKSARVVRLTDNFTFSTKLVEQRRASLMRCGCTGTYSRLRPHLGSLRCHLAAFICATPAGIGAFLTMGHLEFSAFIAAGVTHVRANSANGGCHLASARHIGDGESANFGAIHIQPDTALHGFDICLRQARHGAMVTCLRAKIASVDTRLKHLMRHDELLQKNILDFPLIVVVFVW
jgi:hypothetical protein